MKAAVYIMPSWRTGGSGIHRAVSRNDRQHCLSCHQCMKLVLLITILVILYTDFKNGLSSKVLKHFIYIPAKYFLFPSFTVFQNLTISVVKPKI